MILLDQGGCARKWSHVRPPSPRLSPYVESLSAQALPEEIASDSWRIVPDASAHILFTRFAPDRSNQTPRTRLSVVGPRSIFLDVSQVGRLHTYAIRFRPGALGALLPISAGELLDRSVPLEDILGPAAVDLEARLMAAPNYRVALDRFGSWTGRLAKGGRELDPRTSAVSRLVAARRGHLTVDAIARQVGVSSRRLRAVTRRDFGLAPKRLTRIVRSYAVLERTRRASWSTIACGAGFHDESHMIHDFTALFGETPRRFLARADDRFLQVAEAGRAYLEP